MTIVRTCQAGLIALVTSLAGVTTAGAGAIASTAEIAQADSGCRQATIQLEIYEQPDRNATSVGTVRLGDRVTIVPRSSDDGWTRINVPRDGYVLSSYLKGCNTPMDQPNGRPIVEGCGQVVNLGRNPRTGTLELLNLRGSIEGRSAFGYDALAPESFMVLGGDVYQNGRYWVEVLAYQSVNINQFSPSPTQRAWASESDRNAPEGLSRNASGELVYRDGTLYRDLNIVRRDCSGIFGDLIVEGQPLPSELPRRFRTP